MTRRIVTYGLGEGHKVPSKEPMLGITDGQFGRYFWWLEEDGWHYWYLDWEVISDATR